MWLVLCEAPRSLTGHTPLIGCAAHILGREILGTLVVGPQADHRRERGTQIAPDACERFYSIQTQNLG